MIQSILEPITILTSNTSSITFSDDDIRTRRANCCGWLQHNEGSPIYKILEGGLYEVSFNANVTSATAGTYYNVSFDKLIKVCCRGDANLTIASVPNVITGAALPGTPVVTEIPVIQNANLLITKKA